MGAVDIALTYHTNLLEQPQRVDIQQILQAHLNDRQHDEASRLVGDCVSRVK
jgi:hypothetical protein